jgi:hypothetical protein
MTDWIDILHNGSYDATISDLEILTGDTVGYRGSGRLQWRAGSGVQVIANTGGGPESLRDFFTFGGRAGMLIPANDLISIRGQTADDWNATTIPGWP